MREILYGRSYGFDTANSRGTEVDASGTVNVKGSWVELTAATDGDASVIVVQINVDDDYNNDQRATPFLVDIGVGGAGSEEVIISNLLWINPLSGARNPHEVMLPIGIPSGTRLSARCQANGPAFENYVFVSVQLFAGDRDGYVGAESLGADTSASSGTLLDISNGANAYGAWVEFASSTTQNYQGLFVMWDNNRINDNKSSFAFNIGIGGSGFEKVIVPNALGGAGDGYGANMAPRFYPVKVPAGSRLAIQIEGNDNGSALSNGTTDTPPKAILYGVY